ncbi:MAG: type II toxin-antitoxin system HicB family antitoxin [Methanoculleus sp.]
MWVESMRAGGVVRQGKGERGEDGVLKMEFTVMIRRAGEGGLWAEVPALPGCYSQGETIEETLENIREAIEGHMEALQQEGQGVPPEEDLIIGKVRVSENLA